MLCDGAYTKKEACCAPRGPGMASAVTASRTDRHGNPLGCAATESLLRLRQDAAPEQEEAKQTLTAFQLHNIVNKKLF